MPYGLRGGDKQGGAIVDLGGSSSDAPLPAGWATATDPATGKAYVLGSVVVEARIASKGNGVLAASGAPAVTSGGVATREAPGGR